MGTTPLGHCDSSDGNLSPETTAEKPYSYLPLAENEIRLLEIRPGMEWDEVCCRVKQYKVDQTPPYAALSYRWGVTDDRMAIRLDQTYLEIMPNAYWSLYYQRQLGWYKYIWLDCICIDQQNVEERSQQVMNMGQIFSRADEVFVWLGLPEDHTEATFAILGDLRLSLGWRPSNFLSAFQIFNSDYWFRAWVVQEILFAKRLTLMSGASVAPWENFEILVE